MINTDALPANPDEGKTYAVKGKTFALLCKKARQKLVFSKTDFTIEEDDNKITIKLLPKPCCCRSAGGGSS